MDIPHVAPSLSHAHSPAAEPAAPMTTPETDPAPGLAKRRRRPLTEAQQALAARYLPLARGLAKPLKVSWPDQGDEFESAACLALVEASQSFDGSRNVKFATFARYRIWGALRDVQRTMLSRGYRDHPQEAPKVRSLRVSDEERGNVILAESPEPVGAALEVLDEVEGWLRKLPSRHAHLCRRIYLQGKTVEAISQEDGCSKSRSHYLHKEALQELANKAPVPRTGRRSPCSS